MYIYAYIHIYIYTYKHTYTYTGVRKQAHDCQGRRQALPDSPDTPDTPGTVGAAHPKTKKMGARSIDVWLSEPDFAMHIHCATLTLHTLV